jgi:hypothetical protein
MLRSLCVVSFLNVEYHIKLVKSIKMKPYEVALWSCCRFELESSPRCDVFLQVIKKVGVVLSPTRVGMLITLLST